MIPIGILSQAIGDYLGQLRDLPALSYPDSSTCVRARKGEQGARYNSNNKRGRCRPIHMFYTGGGAGSSSKQKLGKN